MYHRYMELSKRSFLFFQLAGLFQELGLTKLLADFSMRKQRQVLDAGTIQKSGLSK